MLASDNLNYPEARIARDCDKGLISCGWRVYKTHGNRFQRGFPDRYCLHKEYGQRWIDYKRPKKNCLTKAQQITWPEWEAMGVGIWILTAWTTVEYRKLFNAANWREFWRDSYGEIDIETLLKDVA